MKLPAPMRPLHFAVPRHCLFVRAAFLNTTCVPSVCCTSSISLGPNTVYTRPRERAYTNISIRCVPARRSVYPLCENHYFSREPTHDVFKVPTYSRREREREREWEKEKKNKSQCLRFLQWIWREQRRFDFSANCCVFASIIGEIWVWRVEAWNLILIR